MTVALSAARESWRHHPARSLLVVAAGALAVAIAVTRGLHEQVGGDFHVFWQAGRNFFTGAPLYGADLPGARSFLYPPFAAFAFQLLAVPPLQVAAAIFSCLNLALWVVTVYLTRDIVARTFPDRNPVALPLVLAVASSAQFFLNNFNLVQVNAVVFVLILLGIRAALQGRDVEAAVWSVVATAIKITPVFFVIWLLLRGRRRAVLTVAPAALAAVLVPLLVRGLGTGATDLNAYYHSFLQGPQHGHIGTGITNQDFGALVYRMLRPLENPEHLSYQYLVASENATAFIYKVGAAVLFTVFLANLGVLRKRGLPVSAFELSTVFLLGHLLSPITRTAHLVTMLFVAYTFFAIRLGALPRAGRIGVAGLWALLGVTGLSGRDLIGRTAYYYVGGYSLIAWTMLLLFIGAVLMTQRTWHPAPAAA